MHGQRRKRGKECKEEAGSLRTAALQLPSRLNFAQEKQRLQGGIVYGGIFQPPEKRAMPVTREETESLSMIDGMIFPYEEKSG